MSESGKEKRKKKTLLQKMSRKFDPLREKEKKTNREVYGNLVPNGPCPPLALLYSRLDKSSGRSTGKSNDCPTPISLAINRGGESIRTKNTQGLLLLFPLLTHDTDRRKRNWTSMDG